MRQAFSLFGTVHSPAIYRTALPSTKMKFLRRLLTLVNNALPVHTTQIAQNEHYTLYIDTGSVWIQQVVFRYRFRLTQNHKTKKTGKTVILIVGTLPVLSVGEYRNKGGLGEGGFRGRALLSGDLAVVSQNSIGEWTACEENVHVEFGDGPTDSLVFRSGDASAAKVRAQIVHH